MPDHNRYLAEMGYTAYARSRAPVINWGHSLAKGLVELVPMPSFDELPEAEQRAWIRAAAAIRRRVVSWRMPAEQEV